MLERSGAASANDGADGVHAAEEECASALAAEPYIRVGFSPHSPYSVSSLLLRLCFQDAARKGDPVCIHAAETREEEQFMLRGEGPLREFLEEMEVLPHDWRPPLMRPIEYLKDQGLGETRALVVHANYASAEEIKWMGERGLSVAWCPPSHFFFGHEPWPLREMLQAGVNVCLGTDSLASSDTLDVMAAAKMARAQFPDVPVGQLLAMMTTNAARALGWEGRMGTLKPGMAAVFSIAPVEKNEQSPLEAVLT